MNEPYYVMDMKSHRLLNINMRESNVIDFLVLFPIIHETKFQDTKTFTFRVIK